MLHYDQLGNPYFGPGIYRIARHKIGGFGDHYGVLSIDILRQGELVIDLDKQDQIMVRSFENWLHGKNKWWLRGECPQHELPEAVARLQLAINNHKGYDLLNNNCEHFASWVVAGTHKSSQIEKKKQSLAKHLRRGIQMGLLQLVRRL